MFYVGDVPWHKLGTRLEKPPATAADAMCAANLNWKVEKIPLYGAAGTRLIQVPDTYAVVPLQRWGEADCPIFGLVSDKYCLLQNLDAFRFFDPIIQSGEATYHTAGALGQGERIWVLVEIKGKMDLAADDRVDKYVLLTNSHDGKGSVQLKFTPVRVVCSNTLTLALANGTTLRVPHRPDLRRRLGLAGQQMGLHDYWVSAEASGDNAAFQVEQIQRLLADGFASIEDSFRSMVKRRLTTDEWTDYVAAVFPDPEQPSPARAAQMERARTLASHLGRVGKGNDAAPVRDTLWAAYNGVTEFLDHRGTSAREQSPRAADKHLHSIWFGQAANFKARAYRRAIELVTTS